MSTILIIVVLILLLGGGGYYGHNRGGGPWAWSPLGIVVVVVLGLWLLGALPG